MTDDEHCLLVEVEGVLVRARQADSVKHAFAILAVRLEDIVDRYRALAEDDPTEEREQEALLDYLRGA